MDEGVLRPLGHNTSCTSDGASSSALREDSGDDVDVFKRFTPKRWANMPFFRPFGSAGFRSTRLPTGKRGVAVICGDTRLPAQPILGRCLRIDTSALA